MEQLGLMMPLSPLENDEEFDISPYWISPPSEKGNQPSSPIEPTGQWNRYPKDVSQQDNCCSLLNPVWRNSPLETVLYTPSSVCIEYPWSSGIYLSSIISRAIVTIDVEQVGPLAQPHHPYDIKTKRHYPRKAWGVTVNPQTEQIFVTDREGDRILVYGLDGAYQDQFGEHGFEPGMFRRPTGIAYDAIRDRLYVVDKDNHRVQALCPKTGRFLFEFGSLGEMHGHFYYPWGIAVSPDGQLIAVTDSRNHRIQLFTHEGRFIRYYNIRSRKPRRYLEGYVVNYPRGIVFDYSGQFLYVTDFNLNRILRLHILSSYMEIVVNERLLKRPSGITLDNDGNILVCDTNHHAIQAFQQNGEPVGCIVRIGENALDQPQDISVLPGGQFVVMDLKGRVRIFDA